MRRTSTVTACVGSAEHAGDQMLDLARVLGRACGPACRRPRPAWPARPGPRDRNGPARRCRCGPVRRCGAPASAAARRRRARMRHASGTRSCRPPAPRRSSSRAGRSSYSTMASSAARARLARCRRRRRRTATGREHRPRPSAKIGSSPGRPGSTSLSPGMSAAVSTATTPGAARTALEIEPERAAHGPASAQADGDLQRSARARGMSST